MKSLKALIPFVLLSVSLPAATAFATIDLELTQGLAGASPIAVVPFAGQSAVPAPASDIARTINQDLRNSGHFRGLDTKKMASFPPTAADVDTQYWRNKKVDNIVVGSITPLDKGRFKVKAALIDLYAEHQATLFERTYTVSAKQMRRLAHHISDLIYEKLTGIHGVFSTRLAYVLVQHPTSKRRRYRLEIADMDGYNPRPLLFSKQPIMSPAWSPDGTKIAYVSFEKHRSAIFVQNVNSGKRRRVAAFPGVNGAPAWSHDGRELALVLTQTGVPKLYRFNLATHKLTQLTRGLSSDTEPAWSPDGKSLIFTSDRGGGPQIYKLTFSNGHIDRLTFDGNYNAHASFTADGRHIILLHQEGRLFAIASLNVKTSELTPLTTLGMNESPSIAPNGSMVLYATRHTGRGVLGMVSIDGGIRLRLPAREGDVQSPVWSPF